MQCSFSPTAAVLHSMHLSQLVHSESSYRSLSCVWSLFFCCGVSISSANIGYRHSRCWHYVAGEWMPKIWQMYCHVAISCGMVFIFSLPFIRVGSRSTCFGLHYRIIKIRLFSINLTYLMGFYTKNSTIWSFPPKSHAYLMRGCRRWRGQGSKNEVVQI